MHLNIAPGQVVTRVVLAAGLALAALTAPALLGSAPPAEAATRTADTASYHGATTTLSATRHGAYLTGITATIQLPRSYANRMRVVTMLQYNGPPAIRDGWWVQKVDADTNGDARLAFHLGSLKVRAGDRVGVWFSDPVTRYRVTHPEIRVR